MTRDAAAVVLLDDASMYPDMEPPRDAAERDARLRSMPGARGAFFNVLSIAMLCLAATVFCVVQAVRADDSRNLGLAVLTSFGIAIFGGFAWTLRAGRHSTAGSEVSRLNRVAGAALLLLALGSFVLGVVLSGYIGFGCYALAGVLSWISYRLRQPGI